MRSLFGRLARERKGAALPIMAAAMLPLMAGIGTAVDVGRIYLVHHQLQSGVDAAALAGARAFGNHSVENDGRDRQVDIYFDENFPAGFLGTPTVVPTRTFQTVSGVNVTTVSANLALPLTFMRLFGFNTHDVAVTARAELQPKPIEVMVVLDDTGSMQDTDVAPTRMGALKLAMKDFISVLHQGATKRPELALGFVTYNVTTNVGAILKARGVAVKDVDGFTNIGAYTGGSSAFVDNALGWRGCVENDDTIRDVSATATTFEDGAWDIMRSLPGETVGGKLHPAVKPYLFPPNANTIEITDPGNPKAKIRAGYYSKHPMVAASYAPHHLQSNNEDGRSNNFYRLGPLSDPVLGERLANSAAYKQFFYDFYIGLNVDATDINDDVIVRASDNGYYAPGSGGYADWKVNYARVPGLNENTRFGTANANFGYPVASKYAVDYPGGSKMRSGATLKMPSPNYQCPEPAMEVQYGREKQVYDDYIDSENYPVMPASGTLHHIGMLWGYRLLTRSDVFTRVNPIDGETPLRALIFMTDGVTSIGSDSRWYGAYGNAREKRITASESGSEMKKQIMRRFAKVCEKAKLDDIKVYIVSLVQKEPEFTTCAGARYWHTTDQATIKSAFNEIAVDLVDLHLTR